MKDLNTYLTEAESNQYQITWLKVDDGAWEEFLDGNFDLAECEENMVEVPDEKPLIIQAKNDKDAIKKAQKELDKEKEVEICMAATIYTLKDGEIDEVVETIFSKAWGKYIEEYSND